MKVQTFSILVGGSACNATCPYCVSRMTPNALPAKPITPNWKRFRLAARLAHKAGAMTAMLTGKGEPTLWPELIDQHLERLSQWEFFPLVELQTNGLRIANGSLDEALHRWTDSCLTTVALSVVHWEPSENRKIYGSAYDVAEVIDKLHGVGLSVRLCCCLVTGYVDSWESMDTMIRKARQWGAEQLTFTPLNAPKTSANEAVLEYALQHRLDDKVKQALRSSLDQYDLLVELGHGARVYDVRGQNVALNNCLTGEAVRDTTTMRNLIFHPDGAVRWDWEHEGARML